MNNRPTAPSAGPTVAGGLLLALLAIGCASPAETPSETALPEAPRPASPTAESVASEGPHHDHEALPLPKRLAFMSGHVEAGLALYRAGEPAMAAPHLLHPVSETHAAERKGLDTLGFDGALFEAVSDALDAGRPASEVEPQLDAAETHLAMIGAKAPGDPADVISYLMDTVVEEYAIAVKGSTVTDPGEYQDAFGFTTVAIQRAATFDRDAGETVRGELNALLALWPEAPIPPESATTLAVIEAQVERVRAALAAIE